MNLAPVRAGRQHNAANQGAKGLRHLPAPFWIVHSLDQSRGPGPVEFRHIGVHIGQVRRGFCHVGGNLRLLAFKLLHPRFHRRLIHPALNGGDDAPY